MVMSPDADVEEVIEAHLQNAENSCENNSFYLDMYVDERASSCRKVASDGTDLCIC